MELKAWTYEDMPEYEDIPEGVNVIETTGKEIGIQYLHDIVYADTPQGRLRLQILQPFCRKRQIISAARVQKNEKGEFPAGIFDGNPQYPCVVYVQGSAWFPQDLYGKLTMVARLAERGFVVAIVEYRDSTRAKYPTPILDTLNAIRFLRKNAKAFAIDPARMVVAGDSSGGHTAVMAGIWCREDKGDNYYPGVSAEVSGIIGLYPSGDFTFEDSNPTTPNHCSADSPEGREMGGVDMTQEQKEELTLRTHVTSDAEIPPVLLFHGTKDRMVNTKCSVYLYQKLKACGKEAELYLLKGADHGGSEFWTQQQINRMENFIRRVTE